MKKESTTSSNLAIKPGSGYGSDESDKKKDTLLNKRKKDLPKDTVKNMGENMKIVATFSSSNRSTLGLQYNILDMYNKTLTDMWVVSPIVVNNGGHSFTVTSEQEDQYLTDENLQLQLVAGVSLKVSKNNVREANEVIAESMINAIANGVDVSIVSESYLIDAPESVTLTESEVKSTTEELLLSLLNQSQRGELSEEAIALIEGIAGKKNQG